MERSGSTPEQQTLMGFAGQQRMRANTQLIYLRARTYDPVTAQFLSPDPLAAVSGETSRYAAANPVNAIDPSGLYSYSDDCPCPPCEDSPPASGTVQQFPELTTTVDGDPEGPLYPGVAQLPEIVAVGQNDPNVWGGIVRTAGVMAVGAVVTSMVAPWVGGVVVGAAIGGVFATVVDKWVIGNEFPKPAELVGGAISGSVGKGMGLLHGVGLTGWLKAGMETTFDASYGGICGMVVNELTR